MTKIQQLHSSKTHGKGLDSSCPLCSKQLELLDKILLLLKEIDMEDPPEDDMEKK